MDNIDIIEKYLKGQLSPEEEKAFREQLKTDKALRDEVLATTLMIKNMKEQNREKEEAIAAEVKKEAPAASAKGGSKRRWYTWAASIAAILVLASFTAKPIYFNYKSNQMMSQNYAQWNPRVDATSRGEVEAGETVVAELKELFENVGQGKDMKMTTYRLEKALKESETDYEYNQYTPDIVWYLALAYIQENQFGKARTALAVIVESGDPYYYEAALKLYKEIENMYFM